MQTATVGQPAAKQRILAPGQAAAPARRGGGVHKKVRKKLKISKSLRPDQLCGVLSEIGLDKFVPIIKTQEMDGDELLHYKKKEFIDLLTDNGFSAPKARTAWDKLESHLKPAEGRVGKHVVRAFVVGIDKYGGGLTPLKNGVKDAYAVAKKLESAGVMVTVVTNVTIDELKAEADKYVKSLNEGDVSLLFYAGHGHMFNNMQRMMAIPKGEKANFKTDTLKVEVLLNKMSKRKTKANIVFLDCCRDFVYKETRGNVISYALEDKVLGSVISYACSPNHSAHDGTDVGHGLYTKCLLRHILTPDIDVAEMLKRVNKDLIALSKELGIKQVPFINSSVNDILCLFTQIETDV